MADAPEREPGGHFTRLRAAAEDAGGTWPARRELADALRALLEELPDADVDETMLRRAAGEVRAIAGELATAERLPAAGGSGAGALYPGMGNFQHTSPTVGLANPVAPPFRFEVDEAAQVVRGRGTFGKAYEGAPGLLHGGLLAAVFDELLGLATTFSGGAGMTGTLTVRYLRPTPIHVELELEGRLDRAEGRRLQVSAECRARGETTARAEGLFVAVGAASFERFAREREERRGR